MSETLTPRSLSRRRFVQSSGALLFAAQCPVGLSRKAYAGSTGAMMNSCLLYTSPSPRDRH